MTNRTARLLSLLLLVPPRADGWLGVYLDASAEAPRVAEVIPDSPAAMAGIKAGDVVTAVDGKPTPSRDAFRELVRTSAPGQRLQLKLDRGGKEVQVVVTLGTRPADGAVPAAREDGSGRPGAPAPAPKGESGKATTGQAPAAGGLQRRSPAQEPAPKSPPAAAGPAAERGYLGVSLAEGDDGVEVGQVLPGSPAASAGLEVGDIVRRWDDLEVDDLADLDAVAARSRVGAQVVLEIDRDGKRRTVRATLGPRPAAVPAPGSAATPQAAPAPAPELDNRWQTDFARAAAAAAAQHRDLLVLYGASWHGPSQAQKRALAARDLADLLERFVCVYVDADRDRELGAQRGIKDLPALEVVRDGKTLWRQEGFLAAADLRQRLADSAQTAPAPAPAPQPVDPASTRGNEAGGQPADAPPAAADAAMRRELEALRREVEELRRTLEELRKARGGE